MFKYAVGAFGMFSMACVVSNILSENDAGSSASATKPKQSIGEILETIAEDMRDKRGQSINGMIIQGASVRGNTLVLEFIVPNAPKHFNVSAAEANATRNMISMYCNRKFSPYLKRGATIVHRFQSSSGLELVDGRLNASTCKSAA